MKLYRIIVLHGGPKDSHTSTETYLVAEGEQAVCEWINKKTYGAWTEEVEDGEEPKMRWDEDNKTEIPFREWVMKKRGDLEDDEGWEDAYYGVTKWGWSEVMDATQQDIDRLVKLGIAILPD